MTNLPERDEKKVLNELFSEEERFPVIETESEPRVDKEIEPLIHKLETDISLTKPIVDNYGQPLISPPTPQQPKIILPITPTTFAYGLTQKVNHSIRWLAEWCFRLLKIFGSRATFKEMVNKA